MEQSPVRDTLTRLLSPVVDLFTPDDLDRLIAFTFDAPAQRRIDALAWRCNDGRVTVAERREYDAAVRWLDFVALLQALARRKRGKAATAGKT